MRHRQVRRRASGFGLEHPGQRQVQVPANTVASATTATATTAMGARAATGASGSGGAGAPERPVDFWLTGRSSLVATDAGSRKKAGIRGLLRHPPRGSPSRRDWITVRGDHSVEPDSAQIVLSEAETGESTGRLVYTARECSRLVYTSPLLLPVPPTGIVWGGVALRETKPRVNDCAAMPAEPYRSAGPRWR